MDVCLGRSDFAMRLRIISSEPGRCDVLRNSKFVDEMSPRTQHLVAGGSQKEGRQGSTRLSTCLARNARLAQAQHSTHASQHGLTSYDHEPTSIGQSFVLSHVNITYLTLALTLMQECEQHTHKVDTERVWQKGHGSQWCFHGLRALRGGARARSTRSKSRAVSDHTSRTINCDRRCCPKAGFTLYRPDGHSSADGGTTDAVPPRRKEASEV